MSSEFNELFKKIQETDVKWIDYRFCDTRGKEQHVTVPTSALESVEDLSSGRFFDGSSISGWKEIHQSDMKLTPDASTAVEDLFVEQKTIILRCNVNNPDDTEYNRDPRQIGMRCENYLKELGFAEEAYFGPEPEFYVFDGVSYETRMESAFFNITSSEGAWTNGDDQEGDNTGHRPKVKGGYFPVQPVDQLFDLRCAMCDSITAFGMPIELHHHEVGTAGQTEIGVKFNTLVKKADDLLNIKYCVMNTADQWGKTATFMPKPLAGDNGSGMHVHLSLNKDGNNLFSGDKAAGLTQEALWFIGGIFKHAHAVNALTNGTVNSYRRLIPGFEAPVHLAYSSRNRSAAVRIPMVASPKARRIELRFPDSSGNPYLTFTALLMAGLDGINNKIDPGSEETRNLYALTPEQDKELPHVAGNLQIALDALDNDRDFLKAGGVMDDDAIDGYIALKQEEIDECNTFVTPPEFALYYSS